MVKQVYSGHPRPINLFIDPNLAHQTKILEETLSYSSECHLIIHSQSMVPHTLARYLYLERKSSRLWLSTDKENK